MTVGLVDPGRGCGICAMVRGVVSSFYFGNPGIFRLWVIGIVMVMTLRGCTASPDGFVYLRNSNTQGIADIRFFFGNPGDVPIAGTSTTMVVTR